MAEQNDKTGERIAKVIARAGLASRRAAEAWIEAGRVSVNGVKIVSPALNVSTRDKITVDGNPLPRRARTRLFLCNKPRGLVTTHSDPEGRPTIFSALPKTLPRLISVGRLDMNTEGLLLLTNDGGLARVLELPATGWLRRYRVRALGRVTQYDLDALKKGPTVDGIHYGPIEATLERQLESNCWLSVGIREGKNREVRRVMESIGLKVSRLIRIGFGPFELGDIGETAVQEVPTPELKTILGPLAEQAEADFTSPIGDDEARMVAPAGKRKVKRDDRDEKPDDKPRGGRGRGDARRDDKRRPDDKKRGDRNRPSGGSERPMTGRAKKRRGRADRGGSGPRPSKPRGR